MNILFVSGIYPPDIGGPATYVSRMAYELSQSGHSIQVLTLGKGHEKLPGLFTVRKVPRGKNILLRCLKMLGTALFMAGDADIIYATGSPWDSWIISVAAARIRRKKLVLKVVGDSAWEWSQRKGLSDLLMGDFNKHKEQARLEFLKLFRNLVVRMADLIITPSAFLRGIVEQWGIRAGKIRVIFNAVENPFQGRIDQNHREREVITVARLMPWKGIDGLIRITGLLPDDIRLIIVGDGPEMASLKEQVKNQGLGKRVNFTGKIAKDDVFKRLTRSTVFALNSRYEGFPHTVLEAMAAGTVAVATDVGGNKEVIKDGQNGLLVPVGDERGMADKITLLFQDEVLRNRLAEEALKGLNRMSWDSIVSETENALRDVLKRGGMP